MSKSSSSKKSATTEQVVSTSDTQILTDAMLAVTGMVAEFNSLHASDGRKYISNIRTQLLGNRPLSGRLVYRHRDIDAVKAMIISDWSVAHDETNKHSKGSILNANLTTFWNVPASAIAESESRVRAQILRVVAYMILQGLQGMRPYASKDRAKRHCTSIVAGELAMRLIDIISPMYDIINVAGMHGGSVVDTMPTYSAEMIRTVFAGHQAIYAYWVSNASTQASGLATTGSVLTMPEDDSIDFEL